MGKARPANRSSAAASEGWKMWGSRVGMNVKKRMTDYCIFFRYRGYLLKLTYFNLQLKY